ncbi:MAG: excalibur calcium-binding domain-containing protein [Pseudonocardiaceae bacterium]
MTSQVRIPASPTAQSSTRSAGRGPRSAMFGLIASFPLSAACAAAGVLMVFGSGQPAPTHQTVAVQSPAAPGPVEPHKPQKAQKAQKHQQAQKAQSASDASFYKNCPEARRPGPPPPRHGGGPGHGSALDRDGDGKPCEP